MRTIGPYTLVSELGRGGMATVYRALGPDRRDVALKLVHPGLPPEVTQRFDRERRFLASLGREEGFIGLLDFGVSPSGPYIVMPLVEGGTLRDRLRGGRLPLAAAVSLVGKVARAVGRAHARGVVHRDLKPENILFADDETPLVADLGIARSIPGASVALSRTGELRGSVSYMAPEQAADASRAGPPADVFSLGAILYECLAGAPAFRGEGGLEILARVERGEFTPLLALRPETPPWLEQVVRRALALDPAARYADAAQLSEALSRPGARSPSVRARVVLPVALLGLGVALSTWEGQRVEPASGPPAAWSELPVAARVPASRQRAFALWLEERGSPHALEAWSRVLDAAPRTTPEQRVEAREHIRRLRPASARVTQPPAIWRARVLALAATSFTSGGQRFEAQLSAAQRSWIPRSIEAWQREINELSHGALEVAVDLDEVEATYTALEVDEDAPGTWKPNRWHMSLPFDFSSSPRDTWDGLLAVVPFGTVSAAIPHTGRALSHGAYGPDWAPYSTILAVEDAAQLGEDELLAFQGMLKHTLLEVQGWPQYTLDLDPCCQAEDEPGARTRHLLREHVTERMWRSACLRRVLPNPWNTGILRSWRFTPPTSWEGEDLAGLERQLTADDAARLPRSATRLIESPRERVSLSDAFATQERVVALGETWVKAPRAVRARLQVVHDDSCWVAVDGQLVDPKQPVELAAGWNRITIKIENTILWWGFSARLVGEDLAPLEGLEVSADGPG